MKINTQLLSVSKKGKGEATMTFSCSFDDFRQVLGLINDIVVRFFIVGSPNDFTLGNIFNGSVSMCREDAKCKFKVKTPESENVKTAQWSGLCGSEVPLEIEIMEQ